MFVKSKKIVSLLKQKTQLENTNLFLIFEAVRFVFLICVYLPRYWIVLENVSVDTRTLTDGLAAVSRFAISVIAEETFGWDKKSREKHREQNNESALYVKSCV